MEDLNSQKTKILEELETAVKLKKWGALHMVELDALIAICEHEGDKGLIYSELFKGFPTGQLMANKFGKELIELKL